MTETGVTVQIRGADGRMQPVSPARRADLIRATAVDRWARARTRAARLAVAVDYLRAAAAAAGRGGVDPSDDLDRVTRAAWAAGETLLRRLADTEQDAPGGEVAIRG